MSCPHCVTTLAVIESATRQDTDAMTFEDVVEMELLGSFARHIRRKHTERAHPSHSDRAEAIAWPSANDEQVER